MAFSWHEIIPQIMMLICEMCSNSIISCRISLLKRLSVHPERLYYKVVKAPPREVPISAVNPLPPDGKSPAGGLSWRDWKKKLINTPSVEEIKEMQGMQRMLLCLYSDSDEDKIVLAESLHVATPQRCWAPQRKKGQIMSCLYHCL